MNAGTKKSKGRQGVFESSNSLEFDDIGKYSFARRLLTSNPALHCSSTIGPYASRGRPETDSDTNEQ